jgi:hypothetical protein
MPVTLVFNVYLMECFGEDLVFGSDECEKTSETCCGRDS